MPAAVEPGYRGMIANHLKGVLRNYASYQEYGLSRPRWVHTMHGWLWLACVRFSDNGHPRIYAIFFKQGAVIQSRYAVQTDACDLQAYEPIDLGAGAAHLPAPGSPGPLY